jgi:hypothetical protein
VLLHDSAYLHTVVHAVETLKKLNLEVLEHPPYRPEPTTEGNDACVVYLSAQNFFFSQDVKMIER